MVSSIQFLSLITKLLRFLFISIINKDININNVKFINRIMVLSRQLLFGIIYYVLLLPFDSIAYIQWINLLFNYKWLASSIIFPFVSILSFGFITFYFKIKKKLEYNHTNISQKKLFYVGVLDSISTITSTLCLPYISIIITITLSKLSIPITMVLSYLFLNKRFYWNHYVSVFIILLAILLILIPYISSNHNNNNPYALIFYFLSLFPNVISDMYKEKILKKKMETNFYWMNTYISLWQLIIGIATSPIMILYLNYAYDYPTDFLVYLKNGFLCNMGLSDNINCNKSLFWLFIYQLISTATSTLSMTIIQYGSAIILLILTNIKLPLTYIICFFLINYNIINNTTFNESELSLNNIISIILLFIGAFLYNYKLEYIEQKKDSKREYLLVDM